MRGLKEIFGGFTSFFIIIPIIWLTGAIINNAYLSRYGAFSWDILDWGNFSSGLLFLILPLLAIVSGLFWYYKKKENNHLIIKNIKYKKLGQYIDSIDYEKRDKKLVDITKPIYVIFACIIFILLISAAWGYGYYLHKKLPRSIGGGRPIYAQFIFEEPANNFVNPDKVYQILDETNHSFILLDPTENTAFDLPIYENNRPVIKYYKSVPHKFLFTADIHMANLKEEIGPNFESFKELMEEWNEYEYDEAFLLGDIFESDSAREWNEDLQIFLDFIPDELGKFYALIGNNDVKNLEQQNILVDQFSQRGLLPSGRNLNWYKKINDDVGVIGLYIPDKLKPFANDTFFNLDINIIINLLETAKDDNLKLIIILTHHGFVGESPWSFQYNLNTLKENLERKNIHPDSIKVIIDRWIKFVDACADTIRTYDKDYRNSSITSDVVIISGHYHSGIATRNLDGIDHIVCPGLSQSDRDGKRFNKNMYLIMDYYPARDIAEFSFKRLGESEVRKFSINF